MCIKHGSCRWYVKLAMRFQAENINTWPSQSCTTEPFGPNMFLYLYLYALPDPTACHFHGCPLSLSLKKDKRPGEISYRVDCSPQHKPSNKQTSSDVTQIPSFQVRIQTFLCNIFVWKWGGKFDLWIWPWMKEGKQLEIPLKFVTLRVRNKTVKTWPSYQRHFW